MSNYLDTCRDAYRLSEGEVNAVLGCHGEGIPMVLSDSAWKRFDLGMRYRIDDPATHLPARRNPFVGTIQKLIARNVRVLACNATLQKLAGSLGDGHSTTAAEIHQTLVGQMLPGVILVPAMIVAAVRAQEAKLGYVYTR